VMNLETPRSLRPVKALASAWEALSRGIRTVAFSVDSGAEVRRTLADPSPAE